MCEARLDIWFELMNWLLRLMVGHEGMAQFVVNAAKSSSSFGTWIFKGIYIYIYVFLIFWMYVAEIVIFLRAVNHLSVEINSLNIWALVILQTNEWYVFIF